MIDHSSATTLALISPSHAGQLAWLEQRNREELLIGAPSRDAEWFTEAGQDAAIRGLLAEKAEGRCLPMVIIHDDGSGEGPVVVGRISISGIVRGAVEAGSLGYWVDKEVTGRGIATFAVRAAVAIAFGALGLHRLQAEVQVGNDASVTVLERCGFVEFGLAPAFLRLGGHWADCRMFQLINGAWRDPADEWAQREEDPEAGQGQQEDERQQEEGQEHGQEHAEEHGAPVRSASPARSEEC